MPKAKAPNAPWVEVWLSPQTISSPGKRQAQFRSDHMHDALPAIVEPEQGDVLIGGIFIELADHARDFGIGNRLAAAARRHIVVGDAERQSRLGHRWRRVRQAG